MEMRYIHISAESQSADVAVFRRCVHFSASRTVNLTAIVLLRMISVRWYFPICADFWVRCDKHASGHPTAQSGMLGDVRDWDFTVQHLGYHRHRSMRLEGWGHNFDATIPLPIRTLIGSRAHFTPFRFTQSHRIAPIFRFGRAKVGYGACTRSPPKMASLARD